MLLDSTVVAGGHRRPWRFTEVLDGTASAMTYGPVTARQFEPT